MSKLFFDNNGVRAVRNHVRPGLARDQNSHDSERNKTKPTESLILAQDERWRRASYMQVERESFLREASKVANGCVTRG